MNADHFTSSKQINNIVVDPTTCYVKGCEERTHTSTHTHIVHVTFCVVLTLCVTSDKCRLLCLYNISIRVIIASGNALIGERLRTLIKQEVPPVGCGWAEARGQGIGGHEPNHRSGLERDS